MPGPSGPDQLINLLKGGNVFDVAKMRARLLTLFGGERGLADWLHDLAQSPDTPATTKAKVADVILDLLRPDKGQIVSVDTLADDEIERLAMRIIGNGTSPDAGKAGSP
jgi:hypothetical protein